MTNFMDLLSSLDFGKIGQQIAEDPQEIERAASAVIPALLGGMQANAKDPAGAESLINALGDHVPADGELPPLEKVDPADGEKIVRNVFGPESDNVARALSGYGFSSGLVMKLMPLLAPLVMSWLSKNILGGGRAQQQAQPQQAPQQSGGGLGGILDSILGGGRQQQSQQQQAPMPRQTEANAPAGVDISDILGDMLRGGGAQQQQRQSGGGGFGLDDLLGGLGGMLGSGRR